MNLNGQEEGRLLSDSEILELNLDINNPNLQLFGEYKFYKYCAVAVFFLESRKCTTRLIQSRRQNFKVKTEGSAVAGCR